MVDIDGMLGERRNRLKPRNAQRKLTEDVVAIVHGNDGLRSARHVSHAIYVLDPEALVSLTGRSAVCHVPAFPGDRPHDTGGYESFGES